jgi:CheY-like chemotaxis protein
MAKILLVEDNAMNLGMLQRRLERRGFAIVTAVDGNEAIEKVRTETPDLILMDLSLPDLDGWEATRRLKADLKTRPIPIIALTAHAMSGDKESALEAGADDYITKPIDLERLLEKMEASMKRSAQPR